MTLSAKSPIIAIFDGERQLDAALSALFGRDYGHDQVKIIRPQDAASREPSAIDTVGAALSGPPELTYNPLVLRGMVAGAGESDPVINLRTDLMALGIGEEDIPRFFHALREGSFVVIADVGADQAAEAQQMLLDGGAELLA
jgi:hypothetical protein